MGQLPVEYLTVLLHEPWLLDPESDSVLFQNEYVICVNVSVDAHVDCTFDCVTVLPDLT